MFWNKSPKLTVTPEDKEWIEECLLALKDNFGEEHFKSIETVLPNKRYYNNDFTGIEEDAEFVLNQTKIYMDIENENIKLEFFSNSPIEMADGTLLSTPSDNIHGTWKSAAGTYESDGEETIINIEHNQLKDPQDLIATMAHELAHYILLGEGRLEENDEYLTDMTAIVYGFGIFLGNTHFKHKTFTTSQGSGWQMSKKGYLPEQIIAYAMAWLCVYRNEYPVWKNMLNKSMLKYFEQSMEYIEKYPEKIRFK